MKIFDKLDTVRSYGKCIVCGEEKVLRIDWFTNMNDVNNHTLDINMCLDCYEKIDEEMNDFDSQSYDEENDWWRT